MKSNTTPENANMKEKILLAVLPFWTPLIPPLGIACLKSYLIEYGYQIKTVDFNVRDEILYIYHEYFERMKDIVPENKRGNFYNIGTEVFTNHLMAYIHDADEETYLNVVKILIQKTFFCSVDSDQIRSLNHTVKRYFELVEKFFIDVLENDQPDILGLSVYKGTLSASMFVARITRERYPQIRIVMGGGIFADQLAPESPNLERFLERTQGYIDKVFIGEGEQLFLKYLQNELPQAQRVYSLADINNQIVDLTTLKVPDFTDVNLELYPHIASFTSRSCPFQCSFCSETVQWGTYRKKDSDQIVRELVTLHEMYGSKLFLMGDSLLNPIVDDLSKKLSEADYSFYWDGYLRADRHVCDLENTLHWRRGGFYRARLGVESGSARILELMGKKVTPQQIKEAVSSLAEAGIKTTTYWIVGYPGEAEEDFQQTLDLITELKDNIWEAECNPFGYYLTGQTKSGEWLDLAKALYPEEVGEVLIVQSWIMDSEPSREIVYERVNRFVAHCQRLGIPNPYTLREIYQADKRWKELHKNAVPSLVEIKSATFDRNERKNVSRSSENQVEGKGDFYFG